MKLHIKQSPLTSVTTPLLIVPIFEETKIGTFKHLDAYLNGGISKAYKAKTWTGKLNAMTSFSTLGALKSEVVLFVGLGSKKGATLNQFRHAVASAVRSGLVGKTSQFAISFSAELLTQFSEEEVGQALSEAVTMGQYAFLTFVTDGREKPVVPTSCTVVLETKGASSGLTKGFEAGLEIGQGVCFARDLANTPSNHLTPTILVDKIKEMFNHTSVKLTVLDQKKAQSLGMHAFLGVAKGSVEPPFMAILTYAPVKNQKPIVLVGKGVTFDSGGISIKPAKGMSEMKGDMGGCAAVLGALKALVALQVQRNVTVIVPLVENMPSGTALKPGDIIAAMNGKTIEVLNTDAEGRLILADALCYAVDLKPECIVDIATLTGACAVALGEHASGLMGNTPKLVKRLRDTSEKTGDALWELPLFDAYLDYLKSDVADIANVSEGRLGGAITAAKFLEQFVQSQPWAHLDIAGTMSFSKTSGYAVKGMSGVGVRTLVSFVRAYQ